MNFGADVSLAEAMAHARSWRSLAAEHAVDVAVEVVARKAGGVERAAVARSPRQTHDHARGGGARPASIPT